MDMLSVFVDIQHYLGMYSILSSFENVDIFYLFYQNFVLIVLICNSLTWEDFAPEINYLTDDFYEELSFANVINYPLGWLFVLIWFIVCYVIYLLHSKRQEYAQREKIQDTPLIFQSQIRFDDEEMRREKLKYRKILEMRLIKQDFDKMDKLHAKKWKKYMYTLWDLYKINLRNDHIWFSLCFRDYGTNYNDKQRIAIMMTRWLNTMAVSGMYFVNAATVSLEFLVFSFGCLFCAI